MDWLTHKTLQFFTSQRQCEVCSFHNFKTGNYNDTGVEKVNTSIVTMSEKKEKTIEKCIL